MKKSVIKFFDKILILLLGFSGLFNSCDLLKPEPDEYGMPHADYELKGVITDKETSNPIPNIRVIRGGYGDTLYTDTEGKFAFDYGHNNTFYLKVEDIDDDENGGFFRTQEISGDFTGAEQVQKGDGRWYNGKFTKTQNIELEKIEIRYPFLEYGVLPTSFKP